MSDVSWSSDAPSANAASTASQAYAPSDAWSASPFEQALQQAEPAGREEDDTTPEDAAPDGPGDGGDDDQVQDGASGPDRGSRKTDGTATGGLFSALAGVAGLAPRTALLRGTGGVKGQADGASAGLAAPGGQPQAAMVTAPQGHVGPALDLDTFADMLEQVAARPESGAPQTFQVSLGQAGLAVTSVGMARLPDGSLAMTIGADGETVAELRAGLDLLKRRLQSRGLPVTELNAEAGFAPGAGSAEDA